MSGAKQESAASKDICGQMVTVMAEELKLRVPMITS